jgi:hypothetical protein
MLAIIYHVDFGISHPLVYRVQFMSDTIDLKSSFRVLSKNVKIDMHPFKSIV